MAIHLTECAALTDLPASKKLVLMACADSADRDSRIAKPGFDNVCRWSGLKRSRAMEVMAELVAEGFLVRRSSGRAGRRAEFYVFPGGCCAMHGPLPQVAAGSATPDPDEDTPDVEAGSGPPDPTGSAPPDPQVAPGSGSGSGSYRTPSQLRTTSPQPPDKSGGASTTKRPSRADGTNLRAVQAAADRATRQHQQATAADHRRARAQAIAACPRCSKAGYLPSGKVCDHDPDTPNRAARGLELVRAELSKRDKSRRSSA